MPPQLRTVGFMYLGRLPFGRSGRTNAVGHGRTLLIPRGIFSHNALSHKINCGEFNEGTRTKSHKFR